MCGGGGSRYWERWSWTVGRGGVRGLWLGWGGVWGLWFVGRGLLGVGGGLREGIRFLSVLVEASMGAGLSEDHRDLCRKLPALVGMFRGVVLVLPFGLIWCFVLYRDGLRVQTILPCNGDSHSV